MKHTFPFNFGDRTIMIEFEADTPADFIEKIAFYDSLPAATPNGATDLRFLVRRPKDKQGNPVTYYSIISLKDNLELKLHQHRANPKSLYSKGEWVRLVSGRDTGDDEEPPTERSAEPSTQQAQASPVTAVNGKQNGKSDQEEKLTVMIRELFDAKGIDNVGAEKMTTLKLLGLPKGLALSDLTLDQKFALYEKLYAEAGA